MNSLKETEYTEYTNLEKIIKEVEDAKNILKKFKWPIIDVSRKSVEETAASVIKIYEINKKMLKIILASKSKVRREILEKNGLGCYVEPSNVDEDIIKNSLLNEGATPETISKNLAEIKANKVSQKKLIN